MLRIQPLSLKYLHQTIALVESTFLEVKPRAGLYINASLDRHDLYVLNRFVPDLKSLAYYIALDTDQNKVLGCIGLHEDETDGTNIIWLGFFCVHPDFRHQGTGKKLLEHAIHLAKTKQKTYFRIKTSQETEAVKSLYEKYDFKQTPFCRQKVLK